MTFSGLNGDNETKIGSSAGLSMSFYDDQHNSIRVNNLVEPIHLYIKQDSNVTTFEFKLINTSALKKDSQFISNALQIKTVNASVHLHIKPHTITLGYLIIFLRNGIASYSSTSANFDYAKILCPNSGKFNYLNSSKRIHTADKKSVF